MRNFLLIVFACAQVELAASGKVFELLEGGLTNRNYVANIEGVPIVVRIGRENPEELGIDRKREYACHSYGAEIGISPKIYCYDQESGLLISKFIEGEPLSEEKMNIPETLKKVVEMIKQYHAAPYRQRYGLMTPKEMIDQYWEQIKKKRIKYPYRLLEALEIVSGFHRCFYDPADRVLCHNDLLSLNFIQQGKKIWLIDWEYGAWNDRFCDLASLCSLNHLGKSERESVLETYFGHIGSNDMEHLNAMCAVMNLRDALWALLQKEKGSNRIDYGKYFEEYFASFWKEIE